MSWKPSPANLAAALLLVPILASPAEAQGRGQGPKKTPAPPPVTIELAVNAAREVLVSQGFEVVRVEVNDDHHIVYYRAGNQGRGRGHGPPARMLVRRVEERVVLEGAPESLRLEIGIKLGIRL
jgi:hypothetical protein